MHIFENIHVFYYNLENTHKIVCYHRQKITQEIDHYEH